MTDEAQTEGQSAEETALAVRPSSRLAAGAEVSALVPTTLADAYLLAKYMAASGMTPRGIDTPEKVLMSIMAGSELGMKPYQSVQSFAIINNRPSLWGDAIPALLYMNKFKIREWFENEAIDYPDTMVAKCEITRPDGQVIMGEFSVADAKEGLLWGKQGPWQTSRKRMLKMRARGFGARDGAADVLRGVFIAEEQQDITPIPEEEPGTGMAARLAARPAEVNPDGFNVNKVTEETAGAAKPRASRKAKEEVKPEGEPAPPVETDKPTPDSATGASTASAVETSSPSAPEEPSGDGVAEAEFEDVKHTSNTEYATIKQDFLDSPESGVRLHADPGEAYLLASEDVGPDGKWTLYKDGEGFSRIGTKGYENFPLCKDHPPKADGAEPEPEIRTDPENRQDPAQAEELEEEGGFEELPDEPPAEEPPTGLIGEMRGMTSWLQIKPRTIALYKEDEWKAMEDQDQRDLRNAIWAEVIRVKKDHRDPVDHAEDPTAFRLWMESLSGPDGADALDGTLKVLTKSERFAKMNEASQQSVISVATARVTELRGPQ